MEIVNDITVHPHHHNWIVSCSNDGSTKIFDSNAVDTEYKTLIQERMRITSLSTDADSASLMATSELGHAWRLSLATN